MLKSYEYEDVVYYKYIGNFHGFPFTVKWNHKLVPSHLQMCKIQVNQSLFINHTHEDVLEMISLNFLIHGSNFEGKHMELVYVSMKHYAFVITMYILLDRT